MGIEPSSRDYTAFTCARGQFHFCRAPFGLKNSPAWFFELMTLALDGLDDFCSFYMDDIVVWSKSLDEHIRHINQLFERIRKHKLKLSLKKSQFMKAESNHLGFIVSPEFVLLPHLQMLRNAGVLLQCAHTTVGLFQILLR